MISVEDATEFVPYGRAVVSAHPRGVVDSGLPDPPPFDIDHVVAVKEDDEQWEVRDSPREELYTRGNTTVWSVGDRTNKCFTLGEKILQALRVTFHTNPSRPAIQPVPVPEEPVGEQLESLVVRDSGVLKVFTEQGQDFNVALQFSVRKCWPCKFGLFIERAVGEEETMSMMDNPNGSPVLFSLLHPLDDFTRVVTKQAGRLGEFVDQSNRIIFTSSQPSLAVTYNSLTEQHSVWRVRRASQQEAEKALYMESPYSSEDTRGGPSGASGLTGSITPSSSLRLGPCSHSPSLALTPGRSPAGGGRGLGTPLHSRSTTPTHSRTNSPFVSGSTPFSSLAAMLRGGQSPNMSGKLTARYSSPTRCTPQEDENTSSYSGKPLPLEVTMCLDHLWTEPVSQSKEEGPRGGAAVKVFLATDCVGQNIICLLSPHQQLTMVKMERANDNSQKIIFGAVRRLAAVDAVAVPSLAMLLVLDTTGGLSLFSGSTRICRVHLPPSPAMQTLLLSQEISALALDSKPTTPLLSSLCGKPSSTPSVLMDSTPCTPLSHKRSSLLTSSRPPSAALPNFGNDSCLGFLSPVPGGESQTPHIRSLLDPLGRQVTLSYSNGKYLTITLPDVAGPLVTSALTAVENLLPREQAVLLHSNWYSARHAPGPAPSPVKEWDMFCRCLLSLAGYQVDLLDLSSGSQSHNTSSGSQTGGGGPSKKCRQSESGCDGDWQYLLGSAHHREVGDKVSSLLDLENPIWEASHHSPSLERVEEGKVNSGAPLFGYIPAIMWSLHLLYEECKLDLALSDHLAPLASLLSRLATDLQLPHYQHHYWQDLPQTSPSSQSPSQLTQELLEKLSPAPGYMTSQPPAIINHLTDIVCHRPVQPYPLLGEVTAASQTLTLCMAALASQPCSIQSLDGFLRLLPQPGRPQASPPSLPPSNLPTHSVALLLSSAGWDKTSLARLPPAVSVPVLAALSSCQQAPPPNWPPAAYRLVEREDLVHCSTNLHHDKRDERDVVQECPDGLEGVMSEISRLRWPKDQRLIEVRRLLQSSKPVTVSVIQRPEISDHDFMEEQEHFLKRLCERTMALPVGRGVAALRTTTALPTETLEIPKLCLTGKAPPRGAKVELSHIDVSQNMEHWPSFHNGVAAGLRLSTEPGSQDIDSTWICFNKPRSAEGNAQTEHAGFLMALGLNGHLTKLGKLESFDYLMKGSEPISIGLLLGLSASRKGSMDVLITKKLATQLEALLPPSATELPLSHNTQVAALMGLGLLYADTGHRRMVEVCLKELGRPPGPELENCVDRESYSLTAGLSLGMITMGRGEMLVAGVLADLSLPQVLHNHMVGGPRPPLSSSCRERPPSYQIREGDSINIDVTSPGATLALGMMYWRSGNTAIASWMDVPDTSFLLEFVRPDFLMLKTLAKGLILWDSIRPSLSWLEGQVPATILPHCLVRPPDTPLPGQENIDYETLNQAYCNIVAGASFVLALRFAGTWNQAAFDTLEQLISKLIAISKRSIADLTGKAVIEQTICVLVLSQGLVMAGSGDLATLRTCRMLRARVHSSTVVTYGSHMAVHLAMGLLFLGGGKLGLSTTPGAVAALICSLFPKFPTHSSDNRYHLQALRHLYVLAVEPRLMVPCCTDTGKVVKCSLSLQYRATSSYPATTLTMEAPVLLPPLRLLCSVKVQDLAYWPVTFTAGQDSSWQGLAGLLQRGGLLPVQRKAGADLETDLQWGLGQDQLTKLQANSKCSTYLSLFLSGCPPSWTSSMQCLLASCLANCTPSLLPAWTSLLTQNQLTSPHSSLQAEQVQTLVRLARHQQPGHNFLHPELAESLAQATSRKLDKAANWKTGPTESQTHLGQALAMYLVGRLPPLSSDERRQLLASSLSLHRLPAPDQARQEVGRNRNPLKTFKMLGRSPTPATLHRIITYNHHLNH